MTWLVVAGEAVGLTAALLVAGCLGYVLVSYTVMILLGAAPPWRALLHAAAAELATTLVLLPLWPLWWLVGASYQVAESGEEPAGGRRTRRPIILLHGLAMNRTNWVWLGRRLARLGFGPLYGTSYFSPQSVARSAAHLARFVDEVLARERASQVDIVAHSLGGIVARCYIEQQGGAARVANLVTIGTPHRGTLLARIGLLPAAAALRADALLLPVPPSAPPGVRYTSIYSRGDAMIVPTAAASLAPCGDDRPLPDVGHLSLLLSRRVLAAVASALQGSSS